MSTSAPLYALPICELAPLLESRQVSPVEVTETVLRRIEALDGRLNTFITLTAERAMDVARAAEREIVRGHYRGPLHGVPVGLKDLFDLAGVPTTFGSRVLRDNVPVEDATVVRRLKDAGAVILGKQNMHEFAFGTTNENPHYGNVANPWDESRVPGGSSGGTAAAVAAGLCYAGLGSDTGGSIRIPSAFCGVAGIKPTYGLVSRAGALPLSWSLDHVGPIARTITDCAIVLQAIAGGDTRDPSMSAAPVPNLAASLDAGVSGLRLGVPAGYYFDLIDPTVAQTVRAAVEHLRMLGASIVEVDLPHLQYAQPTGSTIMSSEGASWHGAWLSERASEYGEDVLLRLRTGSVLLASEYLAAQKMRTLLQQDFARAFEQVDAMVAPTVAIFPPIQGTSFDVAEAVGVPARGVLNRLTVPSNLTGMPAASVPCGFVQGLPVGLQLMGPAFADGLVLRIARAYERSTDWHTRRPIN